jgi:hypothetical protein
VRKLIPWNGSLAAIAFLLVISGCHGLDDDSGYEIRTYASFFLVKTQSGNLSLYQYRQDLHQLDSSWNSRANISDADLSDAGMVDNLVWLASGNQHNILQVNPTSVSIREEFGHLPLAPHHFAIGEKLVLVADSLAHEIAFLNRKTSDIQKIQIKEKPGICIYNSGKFYLNIDDSLVAIYDESAMTPRATVRIGSSVDELLLNRYHAIVVMSHDSLRTYRVSIDPNADHLIGENYPVFYAKLRPTPYFNVRFGREYLSDLLAVGPNLTDEASAILADSILDFEADFFEGTLFYTRGRDFVARPIDGLSVMDSLSFQGRFVKSFHQYARDEG